MESINDGGSGFKFESGFRVESFCFSQIPVIIFRQDRKKTDDRRAFGVISRILPCPGISACAILR